MADLAAVLDYEVGALTIIEQDTLPAGVAITAGQAVSVDANGDLVLADANPVVACHGIALTTCGVREACTFLRKGLVDLGDVMDAMAVLDLVYISDTAGRLADAQVNGVAAIGTVYPVWGATAVDKVLRIDL